MPRSYRLYLEDILSSISKIQAYAGNLSYDSFRLDEKTVDAVVRNLEIIGEASRNIPQEVKDKHPSIEWPKIAAFRNILAHEYFGLDYEILWDIIKNKLPELYKRVKIMLDLQ